MSLEDEKVEVRRGEERCVCVCVCGGTAGGGVGAGELARAGVKDRRDIREGWE